MVSRNSLSKYSYVSFVSIYKRRKDINPTYSRGGHVLKLSIRAFQKIVFAIKSLPSMINMSEKTIPNTVNFTSG